MGMIEASENTAKPGSTRTEEKVETVYLRCLEVYKIALAGADSLIRLAVVVLIFWVLVGDDCSVPMSLRAWGQTKEPFPSPCRLWKDLRWEPKCPLHHLLMNQSHHQNHCHPQRKTPCSPNQTCPSLNCCHRHVCGRLSFIMSVTSGSDTDVAISPFALTVSTGEEGRGTTSG